MSSGFVGTVSLVIALFAVAVAVWHVRASIVAGMKSNSLPVTSDAFKEFRSQEFQAHLARVWEENPPIPPEDGFRSLPADWRSSAYEVAYFFEYLGVLVAYELAPKDLVIDFAANNLVRSWNALEPFIKNEREYRRKNSSTDVSPNFVSHFEHLVALSLDPDGRPVDNAIHERLGLRKVP